jgi:hypothetical protein
VASARVPGAAISPRPAPPCGACALTANYCQRTPLKRPILIASHSSAQYTAALTSSGFAAINLLIGLHHE